MLHVTCAELIICAPVTSDSLGFVECDVPLVQDPLLVFHHLWQRHLCRRSRTCYMAPNICAISNDVVTLGFRNIGFEGVCSCSAKVLEHASGKSIFLSPSFRYRYPPRNRGAPRYLLPFILMFIWNLIRDYFNEDDATGACWMACRVTKCSMLLSSLYWNIRVPSEDRSTELGWSVVVCCVR